MPARKMISRRGMGRSSPFKKGDKVVLREDVLQRHARSVPAHLGYTREQFAWRDTLRKEEGKVGTVERTFEGSQHISVQFPDGKLIGINASELKKADEKKESPVTIKQDGKVVATVKDSNEAFTWILNHQGQSVDYALRYGGYSAEDSDGKQVLKPYSKG